MTNERINWVRLKVDREKLKELNKRSDLKAFKQVIIQLLLTIILGILSYISFETQPLWVSLILFYMYATVFSFAGYTAAIHELSHNTPFKTKWLNEAFVIVFSLMTWSDYVYFRASHGQHHAFTTYKGLDHEVVQPVNASVGKILKKFIFDFDKINSEFSGVIGIFRRSLGIINPGREEILFGENTKLRDKMVRWNRILIGFHLVIIVVIMLTSNWLLLLHFSFTAFFGQGLNIVLSQTQHAGLQANTNDFRKNCRSIKLPAFLGFLYWQMHYHVEHHMYAGVPFYNLKNLRQVLEDQLPERKGLVGSWVEILKAREEQRGNSDFYIEVIIPAQVN